MDAEMQYNVSMLIRQVVKKNKGLEKKFIYHHLVESVRTPRGPRQRLILNLGRLDIPRSEWKILANRIEEIISGQETFLKPPRHIEDLARHYAAVLINKRIKTSSSSTDSGAKPGKSREEWETVDPAGITASNSRTVGGEALAHYAFETLGFPGILRSLDFSKKQIHLTELLIAGRLLHPGSEQSTLRWGRNLSAIGEVSGADFTHLSNNILYRMSDSLLARKADIEKLLAQNERNIMGLEEKILLYDLTNSYLEGSPKNSEIAKRGHSKEKRSDCPLLTLALILDEDGFPKGSFTFPGNVSEPGTLKDILDKLIKGGLVSGGLFSKPTVVIDAGIATKANIQWLRDNHFHYVCVSRTHPDEIPVEGLTEIRTASGNEVSIKKIEKGDEVFLFCRSSGRKSKEEGIKNRFTKRFEEGLKSIERSIRNPRGRKSYDKIMERVGRLKEKCSSVSRFYYVNVERDDESGNASSIEWRLEKEVELESHFNGSYYIRSDRTDLADDELWKLYVMLTHVEDGFRCLKNDLGLRPNYHQKDGRMEGHLFISVLAYHLLAFIRRKLRQKGINRSWHTIRDLMSSQTRITTSLTTKDGRRIHIRQTTEPEDFHIRVYRALSLPTKPLKMKKIEM